MRSSNARETMTPREREEFEQEKTIAQIHAEYQIEAEEIRAEILRLEMRWTQIFRLPFAIVLLPVRIVFAFSYIAHAIRGTKPDDKFWEYLREL